MWDAESGRILGCLRGHTGPVNCLAISSDGTWIVSGSGNGTWGEDEGSDNTVRLWDVGSQDQVLCFEPHGHGVRCVAVAPDGNAIAIGLTNGTGLVCDPASGEELISLFGHRSAVESIVFSPDGQCVISGAGDRTVRVWDRYSGDELICLRGHHEGVNSVAILGDGSRIVSGSEDRSLRVWNACGGEETGRLIEHDQGVRDVVISPDGRRIVSADDWRSTAGAARVWDTRTGKALCELKVQGAPATCAVISPAGQRLVSGHDDCAIRLWRIDTGEELGYVGGHWVRKKSIPAPGGRLTAFRDVTAVWEGDGHDKAVACLAFSPDGRRLVSGSDDKSIRVWDASKREQLICTPGHEYKVEDVAFSPDASRIVSAASSLLGAGTTRLWDAVTGEELGCTPDCGHNVAFSADGRRIACGSSEEVRILDAETLECVRVIEGGSDVEAVAGGSRQYPFRARRRSTETVFEDPETDSGIARFPMALRHLATHPSGTRWAGQGDDRAYLAILTMEGPAIRRYARAVTATCLWRFADGDGTDHWDDALTAFCPWHLQRVEVTEDMLGDEIDCPECGEPLKINDFVCDWSDRM
jgi:WD40 repeat protein